MEVSSFYCVRFERLAWRSRADQLKAYANRAMHKAAGLAGYFSGIDLVKLNSAVAGRVLNVSGQSFEPQALRASAFAGYADLHWAFVLLFALAAIGLLLLLLDKVPHLNGLLR